MNIELTEKQIEEIGRKWLASKCEDNYTTPLTLIFKNRHMAQWCWSDALSFAIRLCCKEYNVSFSQLLTLIRHK